MESYLLSAVGVLSACVGVLFGLYRKSSVYTERRLKRCEEERDQLFENQKELWEAFVDVATASMSKSRQDMQYVKDVATAHIEGKRPKPPSDRPAEYAEETK